MRTNSCKHCHEQLTNETWPVHWTGAQFGSTICFYDERWFEQADDYFYKAEPIGTECLRDCKGSHEDEAWPLTAALVDKLATTTPHARSNIVLVVSELYRLLEGQTDTQLAMLLDWVDRGSKVTSGSLLEVAEILDHPVFRNRGRLSKNALNRMDELPKAPHGERFETDHGPGGEEIQSLRDLVNETMEKAKADDDEYQPLPRIFQRGGKLVDSEGEIHGTVKYTPKYPVRLHEGEKIINEDLHDGGYVEGHGATLPLVEGEKIIDRSGRVYEVRGVPEGQMEAYRLVPTEQKINMELAVVNFREKHGLPPQGNGHNWREETRKVYDNLQEFSAKERQEDLQELDRVMKAVFQSRPVPKPFPSFNVGEMWEDTGKDYPAAIREEIYAEVKRQGALADFARFHRLLPYVHIDVRSTDSMPYCSVEVYCVSCRRPLSTEARNSDRRLCEDCEQAGGRYQL